jgi:hypothetical protein
MAELHFKDASGVNGQLAMGLKHEQVQLALLQIRSGIFQGLDFR